MLFKLYKELIIKPKTTFRNIHNISNVSNYTVRAFLLLAILFIIPNIIMVLIKAHTPIPPIVIVPPKFFYHWILFIGIPAQIPLFIMTTGIFYLLTGDNKFSFKQTFFCITLSLSLPFFLYAIFEIVLAIYLLFTGGKIVPFLFQLVMYITMAITILGHIFFLYKLTRSVTDFKKIKSFKISVLCILIFWIFASLFFG